MNPQRFTPAGDDEVPAHVLDELLAAFGAPEPQHLDEVDFDDPSIDALLRSTPADASATAALTRPRSATLETRPLVEREGPDSSATHSLDERPAVPARRATIHIGSEGDELPDAIYLDEDGEKRLREIHGPAEGDDGTRSTVVIADLDEAQPAVEPLPDRSSGAIDPRLRARRIAVGRAKGRRRLVIGGIVALVLLIIVGVIATFASSLFDVRAVHWQGTVYTDAALREEIEAELRGRPVLLVDTRRIERQLEASPWVEDAAVATHFPHSVTIDVRERQPVVAFRGGNDHRWRIVDRDGRVLDVIDNPPDQQNYMWVVGANPDTERGASAGALYAAAAQLWIAVPPEIRALTTSIGVDTAAGTLSLTLHRPDDPPQAKGIDVRLGDPSNLPDKLARLLQIVRHGLANEIPIDVSTDDVSLVKP